MSGGSGERTEQPTAKKRRDARRKGQVARSQDLGSLLIVATGAAALASTAGGIDAGLRAMFAETLAAATAARPEPAAAVALAGDQMRRGLTLLLPVVAAIAAVGLLASFAQVGPLLTLDPLVPKLERLDPFKGIRNRLFSAQAWIGITKTLLVLLVLSLAGWAAVEGHLVAVLGLAAVPVERAPEVAADLLVHVLRSFLIAFAAIAVFDLLFQRWDNTRKLRMTQQEVKREFKESEGDPHQRGARKRAHEELLEGAMLRAVPDGDVCVVNPTHVACVLRYDPDREQAPRLLAKGRGHMAASIRTAARYARVPIVRNVGLARSLVQIELDQQIPVELEKAAVVVFRWVDELLRARGRTPRWAPASGSAQRGPRRVDQHGG